MPFILLQSGHNAVQNTQFSHGNLGSNSDNDVLFQDEDVCVLRPNCSKGIVIYHIFDEKNEESINTRGLILHHASMTGERSISHPYNFFRAPAYNYGDIQSQNPSLEEVNQNYATKMEPPSKKKFRYFCIRIDPAKTYVYLSEARFLYFGTDKWKATRKTLADYQEMCIQNKKKKGNFYHAISGIKLMVSNDDTVETPPEYNGEVLVRCDIPVSWRVHITA